MPSMFHWYFRSICNKISSNSDAVFVTEMLKTGLKSIHFKCHNYKGKVCITDPSCWLGGGPVRGGWVPEQHDGDRWSSSQALLSSCLFTSLSSSHYQVYGGVKCAIASFFYRCLSKPGSSGFGRQTRTSQELLLARSLTIHRTSIYW